MNLTLTLLNLGIIGNSPLIQLPQLSQHSSFSLTDSNIVHSTINFFQSSDSYKFQYAFINSRFIHFLRTPLTISKDDAITKSDEIFHTTLEHKLSSNLTVTSCQFINIISEKPGAAIHLDSKSTEFKISRCFFDICRCKGKGGAIFALMNHMDCQYNCFHLCRCGKENGNDGSTVYAFSQIGIDTKFISCNECPRHGDQCWYGIVILCNGRLETANVNMSNSDVEFISGLAHFRPNEGESILKYYTAINQINGNSLAFIDMTFHGTHQFGSLVNNTSKTGIFYVQNSTTTLMNFYFLNNTGPITYMCVGNSKANFESCVFSSEKVNLGIGYGKDIDCLFGQLTATPMKMELYGTAVCETQQEAAFFDNMRNNIDINNYFDKNGLLRRKNKRDLMLCVLIVGLVLIIYTFFSRFKGRRIRIRDRNL
ncbi:hypothetical protein M9Y10_014544 [Tritrichomonas musculus]|uniref:Uncharacterized protein n=1 Tax=Tritrichomonas musculus TaxID=1915356 RepID=A0ABR2KZU2_9EUKA